MYIYRISQDVGDCCMRAYLGTMRRNNKWCWWQRRPTVVLARGADTWNCTIRFDYVKNWTGRKEMNFLISEQIGGGMDDGWGSVWLFSICSVAFLGIRSLHAELVLMVDQIRRVHLSSTRLSTRTVADNVSTSTLVIREVYNNLHRRYTGKAKANTTWQQVFWPINVVYTLTGSRIFLDIYW